MASTPYEGPPISLRELRGSHIAVVHAPTPGWEVRLDRVEQAYGRRDVFITIQRPNPAFVYPQVVVEQQVATTVSQLEKIGLLARVLNHDAPANSSAAYSRVAQPAISPAIAPNPPDGGGP